MRRLRRLRDALHRGPLAAASEVLKAAAGVFQHRSRGREAARFLRHCALGVEPPPLRARLLINHTVLALKGTAMTAIRIVALSAFAALAIALVTGPAGSAATPACGGGIA